MNSSILLTEEIERIKFLSGYQPDELASDQKALMSEHRYATYNQNKRILSEQQAKPGVKPVAPKTGIAKPGVTNAAQMTPEQKKKIALESQKNAQNVYNLLKKS